MSDIEQLRARLPAAPDAVLAALTEVDARPMNYPVGSGQSDEIALVAGLRPVIRELLSAAHLEKTRASFEARGFATLVSPRGSGPTRDGALSHKAATSEDTRRAVFVGRDRARLEAALAADLADDDRELGRLLGYPRCCVEAFVTTKRPPGASWVQRRNHDLYDMSVRNTQGRPRPRLNMLDLNVFHYISWSPCSFECPFSLRYADAVADRIANHWPAFVERVDAALSAHRLVLVDDVQLSIRGVFDGKQLRVNELWATARDHHPRASWPADRRNAVAQALTAFRAVGAIAVTDRTIFLDGRELSLELPPLLVPFGDWA
jgi:hypothetical protein